MEFTPADASDATRTRVLSTFDAQREGALDERGKQTVLFVETYPRGIEPSGRSIKINPDAEYILLGGYDLYATGATTFWFADYTSTARKVACYPQVPLTWVTLGLWQLVVPLSWPCAAKARMDRPLVWNQIRHIAAAADADAAVVLLKNQDEEVIDAWGWLLRKKSPRTE